ncbi:VOC family protein [Chloroflexota bacterium]
MKVEKLDRVAINVKNLDAAVKLFSDLFGINFYRVPVEDLERTVTEHGDRPYEELVQKVFISPTGLHLREESSPVTREGIFSFHLKVSNLEEAKAEMKAKGIRLIMEYTQGGQKGAVYSSDDLFGVRIVLVEYEGPSAIEAMLREN